MKKLIFGLLLGLYVSSSPISVYAADDAGRRLFPVDQAKQDPLLLQFRAHLLDVAKRRDVSGLQAVMAANITCSFGGDGGIEECLEIWGVRQKNSPMWAFMTQTLRLGGSFLGSRHFIAPYTSSEFPEGLSSFDHFVVTKPRSALRAAPNSNARVIEYMNYDIVRGLDMDTRPADRPWHYVRSATSKQGFVSARDVRSPADFRLYLEKNDDRWVIMSIIAGD